MRRNGNGPGQRGAAIVEFIIILPLLAMLIFGVIQFGIAMNRVQGLNHAAREGARLASLRNTTEGEVANRVTDALAGVNYDTAPTVAVSPGGTPCLNREGQTVSVVVQATHQVNVPFLPPLSLNLTGNGTFRCEGG